MKIRQTVKQSSRSLEYRTRYNLHKMSQSMFSMYVTNTLKNDIGCHRLSKTSGKSPV